MRIKWIIFRIWVILFMWITFFVWGESESTGQCKKSIGRRTWFDAITFRRYPVKNVSLKGIDVVLIDPLLSTSATSSTLPAAMKIWRINIFNPKLADDFILRTLKITTNIQWVLFHFHFELRSRALFVQCFGHFDRKRFFGRWHRP